MPNWYLSQSKLKLLSYKSSHKSFNPPPSLHSLKEHRRINHTTRFLCTSISHNLTYPNHHIAIPCTHFRPVFHIYCHPMTTYNTYMVMYCTQLPQSATKHPAQSRYHQNPYSKSPLAFTKGDLFVFDSKTTHWKQLLLQTYAAINQATSTTASVPINAAILLTYWFK